MDERRCLDGEYTHRRSDRYTGAASEKKGETEYTEFLSQWISGDVFQRRKERRDRELVTYTQYVLG